MTYPPHQELEKYRSLIEAALAYDGGKSTWEDVVEEVTSGRAFLMVHPSGKSVAVLQPIREVHMWAVSGEIGDIFEMEEEAATRARASGFDRMTLAGRKGWERVFKSLGWKPETGLVKDL